MNNIVLAEEQKKALADVIGFYIDPDEQFFVIEGYSGTGKTTLIDKVIDELPNVNKTLKLINATGTKRNIILTATTNKAAEVLTQITGHQAHTIHSVLNLRVQTNYQTNETKLVPIDRYQAISRLKNSILIIDESSLIDDLDTLSSQSLLTILMSYVEETDCKVIFVGDPAQLVHHLIKVAPIFRKGFPTAKLITPKRQAENSFIVDLAFQYKDVVEVGDLPPIRTDNEAVIHVPRSEFENLIVQEFGRQDWKSSDSKLLAWTNKTVTNYNQGINNVLKGTPHFQKYDYAVNNSYIQLKNFKLKTDQTVKITNITPVTRLSVKGFFVEIDYGFDAFMPETLQAKKAKINKLKRTQPSNWKMDLEVINKTWIDLRAAYACTVNKSQGSTYDKVYIDLDDINKCRNPRQVARMLYVAISRARYKVILTGKIR